MPNEIEDLNLAIPSIFALLEGESLEPHGKPKHTLEDYILEGQPFAVVIPQPTTQS